MRLLLVIVLLLAVLPIASARSGHITALSVNPLDNQSAGTVADLFLEVRPGSGSVYIESYPLTRIDTQISTRFAKEIACQRVSVDCNQYDFFYIINVGSGLVGGPSAGGALAVLTYAVLEDKPLRNDTAMTGALLSGGVIGSVGGVPQKVAGAALAGYDYVVVPARESSEDTSAIPLADRYDVTIIAVKTLDEAIQVFTDEPATPAPPLVVPTGYTAGMERVAASLCQQSRIVRAGLPQTNLTLESDDYYSAAQNASGQGLFYTAASLCFTSSLRSHTQQLIDADNETRRTVLRAVRRDHQALLDAMAGKQVETIADLEISMVVAERLAAVGESLDSMDDDGPDAAELAYASERLETARSWYSLLGSIESRAFDITPERLRQSCRAKIEEAQERVNYLVTVYPAYTDSLEARLQEAFASAQAGGDLLCLLQASQAKAEANALLTAVSVPEEDLHAVIREKIAVALDAASWQARDGAFPILAYSYAEYAGDLLGRETYTASLYAEYALEFTQLDIYFPPRRAPFAVDMRSLLLFIIGLCIGAAGGLWGHAMLTSHGRREKPRPKKRRVAAPLPGKKR